MLVLIIASSAIVIVEAADWTMYRGPNHTGISGETGWYDASAGVKILWKQKIGIGFGSIAVSGGRAYAMGNKSGKDTVFCFDAKTGRKVWAYSYPARLVPKLYEGGPGGTPTVDGKYVYTLSKHGDLYCLSADGGSVKWKVKIKTKMPGWGFAGSPLVVGDLLILNTGSAGAAYNKKTGRKVWSSGAGASGYATPVPIKRNGKPHVIIFTRQSVVIVAVANGKKVWEAPWKTKYDVNAADPIIAGKNLFISSGYNAGCCLLPMGKANPKPIWKNKNMRNKMSGCVLLDGHVYGFDETKLTCLDLKTGKKKWSEGSLGRGTVMMADGKLILLSERGKLVIASASPDGYKELSSGVILKAGTRCWSMPALCDGLIYARNAAGDMVCVKVKK
ncbi:MAG: PQQ-binding-like beta-propeller repeat protein [bacterium]|nr:PQQ-binding-like beta-propeller repeat protein [bacterium]